MSEQARDAVLVGFDGSIPARLAVYWAAQEAPSQGVPLRLVHVFRWPLDELAGLGTRVRSLDRDSCREAAAKSVAVAAEHSALLAPEVKVTAEVVDGEPVRVLSEMARHTRMLVLGASGQSAIDEVLIGSSSAELARRVTVPVVVIRGNSRLPLDNHRRRVVVGVDDSPESLLALRYAFDFADRHHAELVAVHAWCDLPLDGLAGVPGTEVDEDEVREDADALLTAALAGPAADHPMVHARGIVALDRPAQALLEQSRGASLLVVGSHGRAQSLEMPLGSVSHVVLHYADCPIAIIRATG